MEIRKIVLIEPEAPGDHVYSAVRMPRLGLPLLGTLLKQRGYQVEIFMGKRKSLPKKELLEADLVGISTTTSTSYEAYRIASYLKNRGVPVIIGGIHATFLPDEAMQFADYVVRGEAEYSFPALVEAMRENRLPEDIPGVSYWHQHQIQHNQGNNCWADVNTLPPPDLSLIRNYYSRNVRTYPVITSRGCPHDCSFCSVTAMFGHRFRYKENEQVLEELSRYQGGNVFIVDDNFAAHKKHTKELLREMLERKISLKWWGVQVRSEIAQDEELLDLMKQNNAGMVFLGLESINPETLASYNKSQNVEEVAENIRRFHDYNIRVHGMFVFGGDGDTRETIKDTVDFALDARIDTVQFLTLTPIPGTRQYEQLESEGRLLTHNWELYDGHHAVFKPKKMSAEELQEDTIRAHKRFYSFRNWWSNIPVSGISTVFFRGMGWWLINRWEKQNQWFQPVLNKCVSGGEEPRDATLLSRRIKAFKLQKLHPLKNNLMQIYLSQKDGVFYLYIKGVVTPNTLRALCREINQAIPEKYFDLVVKTEGLRFASEKSAKKFSSWLNSMGDRARQLNVVGHVGDRIQKLTEQYNSTIPRFEVMQDK